jgi:hypothetical protein
MQQNLGQQKTKFNSHTDLRGFVNINQSPQNIFNNNPNLNSQNLNNMNFSPNNSMMIPQGNNFNFIQMQYRNFNNCNLNNTPQNPHSARGNSPYNYGISSDSDSRNSLNNNFNNSYNSLENSMNNLTLKPPSKKVNSSGNLSYSKNKLGSVKSNKRSLFLTDKRTNNNEEDQGEPDLQSFLKNLKVDLHTYICNQKGSR